MHDGVHAPMLCCRSDGAVQAQEASVGVIVTGVRLRQRLLASKRDEARSTTVYVGSRVGKLNFDPSTACDLIMQQGMRYRVLSNEDSTTGCFGTLYCQPAT